MPSGNTTPEPPVDRPTKMRWGCVVLLFLGAVVVLGVRFPGGSRIRMSGQLTAATLQAQGISKAIQLYSQDHDGEFPTAETNSNQAFRKLFPDYVENERVFGVYHSAWHDAAPGKRPDGDIGVAPEYSKCLERGENHWAYVAGLNDKSPANLPIIADGFVENEPGTYTDTQKSKGGVWKGKKAVVVFIDGSAQAKPLSPTTDFRILRFDPTTRQDVNIFTREAGLPEGARTLNPE